MESKMKNKVVLVQKNQEDFLDDREGKKVDYKVRDVDHDLMCLLYNPENKEAEDTLHDFVAYIKKNFDDNVTFFVSKDSEGFKNIFKQSQLNEPRILE